MTTANGKRNIRVELQLNHVRNALPQLDHLIRQANIWGNVTMKGKELAGLQHLRSSLARAAKRHG